MNEATTDSLVVAQFIELKEKADGREKRKERRRIRY